MVDLKSMNSFILQQIIKKRPTNVEGNVQDRKKQRDHFLTLVHCIERISDGQAKLIYDDGDMTKFIVKIQTQAGPYAQGLFSFRFKLPDTYPSTAPKIKCTKKIYHPNIDDEGDICLSIVNDWSPNKNDLVDCVQGLLFLLYNPNLNDPLSPYFAPGEDYETFLHNVKVSMNGCEVSGVCFDKVLL